MPSSERLVALRYHCATITSVLLLLVAAEKDPAVSDTLVAFALSFLAQQQVLTIAISQQDER
jgi:hypothetical protein